jgi:N-acyl-D-aspartate/D-glutamate deacylase
MKADVVLIDPEAIADRANVDRPHQYAVGVRDVIIGRIVLRNGTVTQERPGRVLYGPGRE